MHDEPDRTVHLDLWRYGAALLSVVVATLVRMWLDPLFGERSPFDTYFFAILFTAWYGGLGPSILAVTSGFLAALYFFVYPRGAVFPVDTPESQVDTMLYIIVGLASVFFSESMHSAQLRAERNSAALKTKTAELEKAIEERIHAQEAYVELLRRFVNAQESERHRISRELHDQCGQDLTAILLGLKSLEGSVQSNAAAKLRIEELEALVDRISREVHHLALELRPTALDDLGLRAAVENYLGLWSSRANIAVDFECRGGRRIPSDIETAIYRVLQEALANVLKHAAATQVSVILEQGDEQAGVIVEDRGKGFEVDAVIDPSGPPHRLGLLGMRERIEAVGGHLEIESSPGHGTTVYARVPLRTSAGEAA